MFFAWSYEGKWPAQTTTSSTPGKKTKIFPEFADELFALIKKKKKDFSV